MKKSLLTTLCAISALLFIPASAHATDYAPMGDLPGSPSQSSTVPLYTGSGTYTSITQQLYYASELTAVGASAGDINALKFYFGNKTTTVREVTRNLEIYIKLVSTSFTEFEVGFTNTDKYTYKFTDPGSAANKVFDGNYTIPATANNGDIIERTINTSRFYWDGTSNILITIIDKTNEKFYSSEGEGYSDSNLKSYGKVPAVTASRFVHQFWTAASSDNFTSYKNSLDGKFGWCVKNSATESTERTAHSYVNYIKFSIVPPIPVPTSPSAGSITANSAALSWTAAAGADSYEMRYGTTSGSLGAATNVGNVTSYNLTGLTDETTYYYQIRTKIGSEYSAWTDEASFTTLAEAAHIHNGITFSKWASTTSLPAEAGNYYLNADVTLSNHYSVPGNINLCLNGHNIYTDVYNIVVRDNKTLAVYDHAGGGRIYGYYIGDNSSYYGLVSIADGGTFVLNGGSVENLATEFNNASEVSYGIYNNATLKLSGAPAIIGYHGDIYLGPSRLITIESGKPLTNTTPYSIFKLTLGPITDGWANMSGAIPSAHFTAKNASHGVCYNSSTFEAEIVRMFSTSDNNASIKSDLEDGTYQGTLLNFMITSRSFTSESFNTICLPFALSNAQLEAVFGAGYDLEEFDHSNLDGENLELVFVKRTALVEGAAYLIKPSIDVVNPVFDGVTFYISEPGTDDLDDYIYFHGTFGPTELTGGNKNLLFLGADNELFWPASTGNLKGFRAYFEVKGDARRAVRARIVQKPSSPTGIEETSSENADAVRSEKILRDGQLFIIRDNKTYSVLGILVE